MKSKTTKKNIKTVFDSANKTDSHEYWNLTEILAGKTFDEWVKIINSKTEKFKTYRKILNNNILSQKILEIVRAAEDISTCIGRIGSYYFLKFCENTKDSEAIAKIGQIKQLSAQVSNDIMFFDLWFMHLDDAIANKILKSKELQQYKYHLEDVRKAKPYTKSEEIEKILSIKNVTGLDAYADVYSIITNGYTFDWHGKQLSKEEIVSYWTGENPKFREKAYSTVLKLYGEQSSVLAELYKNIVTDWCNEGIKIRGYKSSIGIRNLGYDVTDSSVNTLLRVVRKNTKLFSEYFKTKYTLNKKAGQKYSYSRYHLYAPFQTKNKTVYDYEYSKKYVLETYKMFDKRFYDGALKIFNEKHVHSHPDKNKRGGAFCHPALKELSPYLLLNHTDTVKDVFTMVHEFGHGIHDLFAKEKQTDLESQASLTICETASVFSEMLMADRLLKESKNDEEKKQILVQLLDNQWATIIRQAHFVIFEIYAHEEILNGATKEKLDEYYYSLLKDQFGEMTIPEEFKHEWNYIPHIHESPFYCYSYAWGNLFVLALYDMYRKEGKPFIEKYVALLSAGGSDSPENLMKKLGANPEDEEFWQRGFNIIAEEVSELKRLSGK